MEVRHSKHDELATILAVELDAFGQDEDIRILVNDLFVDKTAEPRISLLAIEGDKAVGHIYLTHAEITNAASAVRCMILAPLAVVSQQQKRGIGQALVKEALDTAKEMGVELVFVLGHPDYYPRCGFTPVGKFGVLAPYPIEEKDTDAWMMLELADGAIQKAAGGTVRCADAMMKPHYWRE